jgi:hypothetical protein
MAHIVAIACFFSTALLDHYGVNPSVLPFDPTAYAIPLWLIYLCIGALFSLSGKDAKPSREPKSKPPATSPKTTPSSPKSFTPVESQKTPEFIPLVGMPPRKRDLSILKSEIPKPIIKQSVKPKIGVSDIEKHVEEELSPERTKTGSDKKFDDLSILRNGIT